MLHVYRYKPTRKFRSIFKELYTMTKRNLFYKRNGGSTYKTQSTQDTIEWCGNNTIISPDQKQHF